MGLLLTDQTPEFGRLIDEIYTRQLEEDREVSKKLDARARQKMCLEDDSIFTKYAIWVYQLLSHLMTYCTREELRGM